MSNKFLPFVVEKTSPENVFLTLVSRTKGVETKAVLAIFCAVIDAGIKHVREYIKTLPPNMDSSDLYESLFRNYADYAPDVDYLSLVTDLVEHKYVTTDHEEVKKLSDVNYAQYLTALSYLGKLPEGHSDIDMNRLYGLFVNNIHKNLKEHFVISEDPSDTPYEIVVSSYSELLMKLYIKKLSNDNTPIYFKFVHPTEPTSSHDDGEDDAPF